MMRFMVVFLSVLVSGCIFNRAPLDPQDQDEQEARMREFLRESSPRNMNQQPKAVPEFIKTYNLKRNNPKEHLEEEEEATDRG